MGQKKKKKRPDYVPPSTRQPAPERADERARRDALRAERANAKQREARREKRRRMVVIGSLVAILAAAVGGYFVYQRRADAALQRKLTASGVCTTDSKTDPTAPQGQNHIASPTYSVDPPAGGDHTAAVAKAGVLRGEEARNLGPIVHALEHGYVVYWHRPDPSDAQRAVLTDLADARPDDVIVVEREGMSVPVAATAWGERLLCSKVSAGALDAFAAEYIGKGPEDVPRG